MAHIYHPLILGHAVVSNECTLLVVEVILAGRVYPQTILPGSHSCSSAVGFDGTCVEIEDDHPPSLGCYHIKLLQVVGVLLQFFEPSHHDKSSITNEKI